MADANLKGHPVTEHFVKIQQCGAIRTTGSGPLICSPFPALAVNETRRAVDLVRGF